MQGLRFMKINTADKPLFLKELLLPAKQEKLFLIGSYSSKVQDALSEI
jgi:hypothetical protein